MFNLLAITITMAFMLLITLILYIVDHYKYKRLLDKYIAAQNEFILSYRLLRRAAHASYRCYKCGRIIADGGVHWLDDVPFCEKHASKRCSHKPDKCKMAYNKKED